MSDKNLKKESKKKVAIKEPKETKEPKNKKKSQLITNTSFNSLIDDNYLTNNSNTHASSSNILNILNIPDDMEDILKEINDSEIAMAIDESFASNLSLQINNSPIVEDFDLILKQIQQNDLIKNDVIKEDEKIAQLLLDQDLLILKQEDEKFARSLLEMDAQHNSARQNSNVVNSNDDDDLSNILENIRLFEEKEKERDKQKLISTQSKLLREKQDLEYEASLQADILFEANKNKINSTVLVSAITVDSVELSDSDNEDSSDSEPEESSNSESEESSDSEPEPEPEPEKPKTKEELRKARLVFFESKA